MAENQAWPFTQWSIVYDWSDVNVLMTCLVFCTVSLIVAKQGAQGLVKVLTLFASLQGNYHVTGNGE